MNGTRALKWTSLLCCTGLSVGAALAGAVTVNVSDSSGLSPQDAVVMFDPLDVTIAPAHLSASIDQVEQQFVPRVSVIRTGTAVTFSNSDHVRHQVYSFSPSKVFTLKLYAGSPQTPVVFDRPGLVVLGCNIHDSMLAFVAIADTPYVAKAGASGTVELTLPPGRYRLRVWHPRLAVARAAQEIVVTSAALVISVPLELSANTPGVAPWPE